MSNKAYPDIKVERPSLKNANLLSHIYASNESELTQIHEYMYQSMVLYKIDPEISKILSQIGKVEMKHLQLLGLTIKALGKDPIYADCNFNLENYWNSNDVYYDTDLKTILEIDIEREKKAIYDYKMLLCTIDDIYIKELIKRIILDEEIHLEIFKNLYKQLFVKH